MQLQQVEFQTQLYCKGSVTLSNKFIYWTLESMYSVKQILTPSIFQLTTVLATCHILPFDNSRYLLYFSLNNVPPYYLVTCHRPTGHLNVLAWTRQYLESTTRTRQTSSWFYGFGLQLFQDLQRIRKPISWCRDGVRANLSLDTDIGDPRSFRRLCRCRVRWPLVQNSWSSSFSSIQ